MTEKQDRFIILKKVKYGEADLIIQALGSDGAKYSFMARSALKSKKRFGGGLLEPIHFVKLTYKDTGDTGKMRTLLEAQLIDDFAQVRNDYDRLDLALYIINCVSHVSLEGDMHSDFLFNLTGHSLRALTTTQNLPRFKLHFCIKLLYQQGVVSIENWMKTFLKTNIADTETLDEDPHTKSIVENYLDSIDLMVIQYIKTADHGF